MNNQRPACEDPHQGKDPKRRQVKPKEINYSTLVPEQEMAHMGWNLPVASQDLQGTGKNYHCKGRYMAEILGIICIVLVSTVAKIAVLPSTEGPEQNKTSLETTLQKACHCCHCLREWFTYSNSCYYFSPEKKSWNESWTSCASKNSSLLYSDDEEDM
ncbi:NKG2-A/NKG2-B type II integral membrane protein-like, partial [Crocuta crocuta]